MKFTPDTFDKYARMFDDETFGIARIIYSTNYSYKPKLFKESINVVRDICKIHEGTNYEPHHSESSLYKKYVQGFAKIKIKNIPSLSGKTFYHDYCLIYDSWNALEYKGVVVEEPVAHELFNKHFNYDLDELEKNHSLENLLTCYLIIVLHEYKLKYKFFYLDSLNEHIGYPDLELSNLEIELQQDMEEFVRFLAEAIKHLTNYNNLSCKIEAMAHYKKLHKSRVLISDKTRLRNERLEVVFKNNSQDFSKIKSGEEIARLIFSNYFTENDRGLCGDYKKFVEEKYKGSNKNKYKTELDFYKYAQNTKKKGYPSKRPYFMKEMARVINSFRG